MIIGHFAELDEDNIVKQVIRASQEVIDRRTQEHGERWIQCSFNTREGVHIDGGVPLRKNYPGMNWYYDEERDAFIPPKRYDSWVLNEVTCTWEAPVPCPRLVNYYYEWDEENLKWKEELIPPEEPA